MCNFCIFSFEKETKAGIHERERKKMAGEEHEMGNQCGALKVVTVEDSRQFYVRFQKVLSQA